MAQPILIVEGEGTPRRTLREYVRELQPPSCIIEAESPDALVGSCRTYLPWLVLMDVSPTDPSGIELTARIRQVSPETIVVVMSECAAGPHVQRMLAAGAFAYVFKERMYRELLPTLRSARRFFASAAAARPHCAAGQPRL